MILIEVADPPREPKVNTVVISVHAIKVYGEGEVWLHSFLATAPHDGAWSASRLGRFATG
jgi:hypothetical protein